MSDQPLVPSSLYGLRTWSVTGAPGEERLAGLHEAAVWPTGGEWLEAVCTHAPHTAPAPGCSCGVHAWHPRLRWARRVVSSRRTIPGVVEAAGAVEVHDEGFRAERARPHALVRGARNPALVQRLAAAYQVPIIESDDPAALVNWCRSRDLGLDDAVLREMIGPAEIERLDRVRRARARATARRVGALVAVMGTLLGLGLHFVTDPPGRRVLFGRTGKIVVGKDPQVHGKPARASQ
jgi:hypothetical protein